MISLPVKAGIVLLVSSCAPDSVATVESILNVPLEVIGPPVNPVPLSTLVTLPEPVPVGAGFQYEFVLSQVRTCPSVGVALFTLFKSASAKLTAPVAPLTLVTGEVAAVKLMTPVELS